MKHVIFDLPTYLIYDFLTNFVCYNYNIDWYQKKGTRVPLTVLSSFFLHIDFRDETRAYADVSLIKSTDLTRCNCTNGLWVCYFYRVFINPGDANILIWLTISKFRCYVAFCFRSSPNNIRDECFI